LKWKEKSRPQDAKSTSVRPEIHEDEKHRIRRRRGRFKKGPRRSSTERKGGWSAQKQGSSRCAGEVKKRGPGSECAECRNIGKATKHLHRGPRAFRKIKEGRKLPLARPKRDITFAEYVNDRRKAEKKDAKGAWTGKKPGEEKSGEPS